MTGAQIVEAHATGSAFFDHVGFEAIYHPANDRVLLVASASGILASRWLAYLDPATVPTATELAARV